MADFGGRKQRTGGAGGGAATAQPARGLTVTSDPNYKSLRSGLEAGKGEIGKILAGAVSPEEMIRFALTAACQQPKLLQCGADPRGIASVGLSLMKAAAMGLKPDGQHGHLVPFWNKAGFMECVFMPDYKGWAHLINRSDKVKALRADVVCENDQFDFCDGSHPVLKHRKALKNRGEVIAAWAGVETAEGGFVFRILNRDELDKRRAASRASDSGPWVDWFEEMCCKSAVHWLRKIAPMGDAVDRAIAIDEADEAGRISRDSLMNASGNTIETTATSEPRRLTLTIPEQIAAANTFEELDIIDCRADGDQREPEYIELLKARRAELERE